MFRIRSSVVFTILFLTFSVMAQDRPSTSTGTIQGVVRSGNTPIPGVSVTATNFVTDEKTGTVTDINGQYQVRVAGAGAYIVETGMAAFAAAVKEVDVPTSLE